MQILLALTAYEDSSLSVHHTAPLACQARVLMVIEHLDKYGPLSSDWIRFGFWQLWGPFPAFLACGHIQHVEIWGWGGGVGVCISRHKPAAPNHKYASLVDHPFKGLNTQSACAFYMHRYWVVCLRYSPDGILSKL